MKTKTRIMLTRITLTLAIWTAVMAAWMLLALAFRHDHATKSEAEAAVDEVVARALAQADARAKAMVEDTPESKFWANWEATRRDPTWFEGAPGFKPGPIARGNRAFEQEQTPPSQQPNATARDHIYVVNTALPFDQVEAAPGQDIWPGKDTWLTRESAFLRPPNIPVTYVVVQVWQNGKCLGWVWMEAELVNYLHGLEAPRVSL